MQYAIFYAISRILKILKLFVSKRNYILVGCSFPYGGMLLFARVPELPIDGEDPRVDYRA